MSIKPEERPIIPSGHSEFDETAALAARKAHELASLLMELSGHSEIDADSANMYISWAHWVREWTDRMFPPQVDFGGDNVIPFRQ